jgi:hypothetical protein
MSDIWDGVEISVKQDVSSGRGSSWSKEDEKFLRDNHDLLGRKECAKKLGRTFSAVCCKAKKMGLNVDTKIDQGIVDFLKENYSKLGPAKCAEILGMPKNKVYSIATSRKIHGGRNFEWHDYEIQYLKDNVYKKSLYEISSFLQRTQSSIKNKLHKLDILEDRKWKDEENILFKEIYSKKTLDELVDIFKRTKSSLQGHAFKLGITDKNKNWSDEDDSLLKKIYPTKETGFCAILLKTTQRAVASRAFTLGLEKGKIVYEQDDMKSCSKCKQYIPINSYLFQNSKNLYSAACKECQNKKAKNRGITFPPEQETEIKRLFSLGMGSPEIAETTKFSGRSKISQFLKQNGLRRTSAFRFKQKFKDRVGKKFNLLTVLDRHVDDKGRTSYTCLCDCGNTAVIKGDGVFSGKTRSCGCLLSRKGIDNPNWGGAGEISGQVFSSIRGGAASRNLEFNISVEYIWDLFLKQNRKCAISGLDLCFAINDQEKTASLDRIDSNLGYTQQNIQWVHKYVNFLKREIHDIDFFTIVKHVYEFKKLNEYSPSDLLEAFKQSPYFSRFNNE